MEQKSQIEARYRTLPDFWKWVTIALSFIGLSLAIFQVFHFQIFGKMLMENSYLYLLISFYLSMVFLFFPLTRRGPKKAIFRIDVLFCLLTPVSYTHLTLPTKA